MPRYINLSIALFLALCAIGCSEIYYPKVNSSNEFLVVDGLITNTNGPFVIKLSKAIKYSAESVSTNEPITNAKVMIGSNNGVFELEETSPGQYTTLPSFVPVIGNSYKLSIKTKEGDLYESDDQTLTKAVPYDSIKSYTVTEKFSDPSNSVKTTSGADIRIDLSPSSSSDKIKCRFVTNLTVQYMYTEAPTTFSPQKNTSSDCTEYKCFGWVSNLSIDNNVNITDENSSSLGNRITNHKIGFIPYSISAYQANGLLQSVEPPCVLYYYLKINQYTLNDATFAFYKAAKGQLNATGKIFDPIATQLYSNIKCKNNPSKLALGFFEVSSVATSALFLFEREQKMISYKVPYVDITPRVLINRDRIWVCDTPAPFTPQFKAYPDWWGHGIL